MQRRTVRILTAALAPAICAVGIATARPAAADATYTVVARCTGSVIDSGYMANYRNQRYGTWHLYYGGGGNCVEVADDTSGKHQMTATIQRQGDSHSRSDGPRYYNDRAAIRVAPTSRACIKIAGDVFRGGAIDDLSNHFNVMRRSGGAIVSNTWFHCGA